MTDAVLATARELASDAFADLAGVVAGLPAGALDWRPAGPETNSIAVLATHAMSSTRLWLHFAVGLSLPTRDRAAEFAVTGTDPAALADLIDRLAADCLAALDTVDVVDWNTARPWTRASGEVVDLTAAYALMHAVEHLRGHVDQASLVRHVWEESDEQ
jgi:hypothetical protein